MTPVEIRVDPASESAELTLPEGACVVCGGSMKVRASIKGAFAICAHCRYIARAMLKASNDTMEVSFLAADA